MGESAGSSPDRFPKIILSEHLKNESEQRSGVVVADVGSCMDVRGMSADQTPRGLLDHEEMLQWWQNTK